MASEKPVRRIKLDSKKAVAKKTSKKDVKPSKAISEAPAKRRVNAKGAARIAAKPATGTWGYVAGSWNELRQVRWPNRSATWSLTLAVIGFTLFFTVIILALDAGFQYLFKEVLLK